MTETTRDGADRDDVLDTLAEWLWLNDPLDPVHFHITISKDLVRDAKHSPHPGVHAGDLICKTTTRWLIDEGYAKNSGGSSSSLGYVTITEPGLAMLEMFDIATPTPGTAGEGGQ